MYSIVTDASADVLPQIVEDNDIKFLQMEYTIDGETLVYNGYDTTGQLDDYYAKLKKGAETFTTQIMPSRYYEFFEPYVKEGKQVMYIGLSLGISHTVDSARNAVQELEEKYGHADVAVIDGKGATIGLGLLVESACRNRAAGMSFEDNAKWVAEHAGKVMHRFIVDDLIYLSRGGRLPAATALLGTALSIKPVMRFNDAGELEIVCKKRGSKQAIKYMLDNFDKSFDQSNGNIAYAVYSGPREGTDYIVQKISEKYPGILIRTLPLSPVIGAHTGSGLVGLVNYAKGER
ncbi:MAG: DegV family protein [Coriobacteriales bacterium]|jgi:DegV family protein with EDD domain